MINKQSILTLIGLIGLAGIFWYQYEAYISTSVF
jgi:hypothetical protein